MIENQDRYTHSAGDWDNLRRKAEKVRGGPPAVLSVDAGGRAWLGVCATLNAELDGGAAPFRCMFSKEIDAEGGDRLMKDAGVVELECFAGDDVLFEPAPGTVLRIRGLENGLEIVSTAAVGGAVGKYAFKDVSPDREFVAKFREASGAKDAFLQFENAERDPLPMMMTPEGAMHIKAAGYDLWFELHGDPGDLEQATAIVNAVGTAASRVKPLKGSLFGKQKKAPETPPAEKTVETPKEEMQMTTSNSDKPVKKATGQDQKSRPRRRTPDEKRKDDIKDAIALLRKEGYSVTSSEDGIAAVPDVLRDCADKLDKVVDRFKAITQAL